MKIGWQGSISMRRLHDYRNTPGENLNRVKRPDATVRVNSVDRVSMNLHCNAVAVINGYACGSALNKIMPVRSSTQLKP